MSSRWGHHSRAPKRLIEKTVPALQDETHVIIWMGDNKRRRSNLGSKWGCFFCLKPVSRHMMERREKNQLHGHSMFRAKFKTFHGASSEWCHSPPLPSTPLSSPVSNRGFFVPSSFLIWEVLLALEPSVSHRHLSQSTERGGACQRVPWSNNRENFQKAGLQNGVLRRLSWESCLLFLELLKTYNTHIVFFVYIFETQNKVFLNHSSTTQKYHCK